MPYRIMVHSRTNSWRNIFSTPRVRVIPSLCLTRQDYGLPFRTVTCYIVVSEIMRWSVMQSHLVWCMCVYIIIYTYVYVLRCHLDLFCKRHMFCTARSRALLCLQSTPVYAVYCAYIYIQFIYRFLKCNTLYSAHVVPRWNWRFDILRIHMDSHSWDWSLVRKAWYCGCSQAFNSDLSPGVVNLGHSRATWWSEYKVIKDQHAYAYAIDFVHLGFSWKFYTCWRNPSFTISPSFSSKDGGNQRYQSLVPLLTQRLEIAGDKLEKIRADWAKVAAHVQPLAAGTHGYDIRCLLPTKNRFSLLMWCEQWTVCLL